MKCLFIDRPFSGQHYEASCTRSRLMWDFFRKNFITDLVLVSHKDDVVDTSEYETQGYFCDLKFLDLNNNGLTHFSFDRKNEEIFSKIIIGGKYDIVLLRNAQSLKLLELIEYYSPNTKIIFDLWPLKSVELNKVKNFVPSNPMNKITNKFSNSKICKLEKNILSKKGIFLFPSTECLEWIRNTYPDIADKFSSDNKENVIISNGFPSKGPIKNIIKPNNKILMYGDFSLDKNLLGIEYFLNSIYYKIEDDLKKNELRILLAGNKLPNSIYKRTSGLKHIDILGKVNNIEKYIISSNFVISPGLVSMASDIKAWQTSLCHRPLIHFHEIGTNETLFLDDFKLLCSNEEARIQYARNLSLKQKAKGEVDLGLQTLLNVLDIPKLKINVA